MSILEDLDLLDLPDTLPDGLDFDLDDILYEFSTPGLFDTPVVDDVLPTVSENEIFEQADDEDMVSEITVEEPKTVEVTPEETNSVSEKDFFAEFMDNIPAEKTASDEQNTESELATEDDYDDNTLFGDPFGICDILYEFGTPTDDEGVKLYTPTAKELPSKDMDDEDVKVYTAAEAVSEQPLSSEESNDDNSIQETILFDAVEFSNEKAESVTKEPTIEQSKRPGFFAKAAALIMGLFASKKAKQTVVIQPAATESTAEDPFANLEDLFSQQDMGDLDPTDELMLELELLAEREAEKEAEAAAREAAERLALEEEQKALELEAQRLAQEEADAEARLRQQEAEAALKQLQAEEEQQQAMEDDLFEWIESSSKRRSAVSDFAEPQPEEQTTVNITGLEIQEATVEKDEPIYDFAAVNVPEDEQSYHAPQMEINISEESSEEIDLLLETPDVEQFTEGTDETPEEAAARKKKEDDELRYVPEQSTAKTISSHIGKRFGAVFSAFTESGDSDREEELGPELPPSKAYRYFNKFINGYRFRMRISAILSVIIGWISLGLPVFGSLKNPAVAAAMCLMLLLTVMLAGADILATGVRTLLQKRPSVHSLVAISCLASVLDAIVIIICKGQGGYLPFCGVSAISMCFAIYGSLLYCRSQRLNFKTLDQAVEPMTISVDYGIVDEDTTTVYRTPGHPEEYIHHSEEEDLSETVYGIIAPILVPAIPVLALLAALISKGLGDFFHIMAAMFAAAASFSALVAFPLPYFLVQRELYATKAAIAGWSGIKEIGRVATMIVTDRDLFPDETVSIKSVRIVDNVPPQLTLSYMCSLINKSGSCLVPAFSQLAENNDCDLYDVENFQCHEAGGLSGDIGPDNVLVASHSYMKLQGFRIPARKKDSENALFLAVNGHVIAYIIMDYKAIKSVRAGLESALRGSAEMIFAARDFNVTPLLISKKFKSATETLRFPSYNQRYEITSRSDSETATCAAVVYRKSFYSYAVVVEKARNLYKSVSWAVTLSAVSSLMGVLLMFVMALTGAGAAVTVGRLLVFMLLWLLPTLALTISITK